MKMEKKILNLAIKRKWFEDVLSGKITKIHKDFTNYWKCRLAIVPGSKLATISFLEYPDLHSLIAYLDAGYNCVPRYDYTHVKLYSGGYFSDKFSHLIAELKEISIEWGNNELDTIHTQAYFVLKLGNIVSVNKKIMQKNECKKL